MCAMGSSGSRELDVERGRHRLQPFAEGSLRTEPDDHPERDHLGRRFAHAGTRAQFRQDRPDLPHGGRKFASAQHFEDPGHPECRVHGRLHDTAGDEPSRQIGAALTEQVVKRRDATTPDAAERQREQIVPLHLGPAIALARSQRCQNAVGWHGRRGGPRQRVDDLEDPAEQQAIRPGRALATRWPLLAWRTLRASGARRTAFASLATVALWTTFPLRTTFARHAALAWDTALALGTP